MKRLIVLLVLVSLLIPMTVMAQEPDSGPIVEGNGGTSIGSINDLRCSGTDCRSITQWLVVPFLGVDPALGNFAQGEWSNNLATSWEVSEDNLTYTFHLRDDLTWSDGEPVDGFDYLFAFYAYQHADDFESPYSYTVADIEGVEVSEDGYTVTVTMSTPSCAALTAIAINMVPSHVFGWEPDMADDFDFTSLVGHDFDTNPTVSGGIFSFEDMNSERVILIRNDNYFESVGPAGYVYVTVPDQTVMAERFMAGELNFIDNPQNATRQEMRENENIQYYDYPGNAWDYLSLNWANPENPQNGIELDEEGNPVLDEDGKFIVVEQEPHPLFADVRVRRAIQLAIDLDEIIEKAALNEGTAMASYDVPASWAAEPDLKPLEQDVEAAKALLAEAGWTPGDDGILVNEEGVRFSFELLTNEGNTRRGQIAELVQDELSEVGIEVNFLAIDFNQLLEVGESQAYDAIILGWRNGYPSDPDWTGLFTPDGDIVGSGFNDFSYINQEVYDLFDEAKNVPGCDLEERAAIYHQVQRILHDDQAYIWLFAQNGFYASQAYIENFNPYPSNWSWNAEEWVLAQ